MQKITTVIELRESIALLKIKQATEQELLKEQFKITYENLKPINLIKNIVKDLKTAPDFKGELLNTALSITAGFVSKKIAIGATHNPLKLLFGTLIQLGVTSLVAKNAEGIKSVSSHLLNTIFSKKSNIE
jgi:hypothetical protein